MKNRELDKGASYDAERGDAQASYPATIESTNALIKKRVAEREKEYAGMTDQEKIDHFWGKTLKGETRIGTSQNPKCKFSIIVPVHDENFEAISRQIQSLKEQRGIDPADYEIIYVVNNDVPGKNPKARDAISTNQKVLEKLRTIPDRNVFVIDKSSAGHEIEDCNVGKARNRGVAEASLRFYENNKNGVLIQTDGDAYFEDPDYLSKVDKLTKDHPDVIGIAGGRIFQFDPGDMTEKEIEVLKKKIGRFILMKKWGKLSEFYQTGKSSLLENTNFVGVNMVSKSYETAAVGGIIDTPGWEDRQFGLDLEIYGAAKGKKIMEAKDSLRIVTMLRMSDRTSASFRRAVEQVDLDDVPKVPDILNLEAGGGASQISLTEENYRKLEGKILEVPGGERVIHNLNTILGDIRM